MLFSWLTEKGVLAMNPAREVKTERFFDFGEVNIRAMVQGVRVISWALGGRLRQRPQRLVVEPTAE
jgi:hypothetical protein